MNLRCLLAKALGCQTGASGVRHAPILYLLGCLTFYKLKLLYFSASLKFSDLRVILINALSVDLETI